MLLTQPEKYSCYALFCFRAATSSLWHLAVIRGKPSIPHISTVNSDRWIPTPLPHCSVQSLDCAVQHNARIQAFRHEAYSHFLSLASAMLMTERLRVFLSVAERSCFLCAVCICLSIVSFSTNGSLSHSFLGSAVVWAAHLKLHQSSRRQKKSCGSAVRRMRYNRGSKCHLDDCLQHFSVVLPSDVHCAACSSTVYSGWAAAVRRFSVTFSAVQLDFSSV